MSALDYRGRSTMTTVSDIIQRIGIKQRDDVNNFKKWIADEFNHVHTEAFLKSPLFIYEPTSDKFVHIKGER